MNKNRDLAAIVQGALKRVDRFEYDSNVEAVYFVLLGLEEALKQEVDSTELNEVAAKLWIAVMNKTRAKRVMA